MLTPALAGDDELEVIHFKSAALDALCWLDCGGKIWNLIER
jgi:hypothetical protein